MFDFRIEDLLPAFLLADRNGYAMAKAVEAALKIMCSTVQTGLDIVKDVEQMPEWRLDEMAWEMGSPSPSLPKKQESTLTLQIWAVTFSLTTVR